MADEFASEDDLGTDEDYQDIELLQLGKKVRVRYLTTPEITQLSYMPNLGLFTELAQKLVIEEEVDAAKWEAENQRYQAMVAHFAVTRPGESDEEIDCDDCGLKHRRSMWSRKKTTRLHSIDLRDITTTAFKMVSLAVLRPLSQDETEPRTPEPAATST